MMMMMLMMMVMMVSLDGPRWVSMTLRDTRRFPASLHSCVAHHTPSFTRAAHTLHSPVLHTPCIYTLRSHRSDVVPASYFGHHHTASVRVLRDDETDHAQHDASSRAVAASADYEGDPGTDADADIGSASTASAPAASASARHVMYLSPSLTPRNPMHDPTVRRRPQRWPSHPSGIPSETLS